jgi:glycine C-acetyltransferase
VRFICGTFACHHELEERLAAFFETEAALTYTSCWNANEGLLPALATADDVIVSDEMNHASIIDAARLSAATRSVFAHSDMAALERRLDDAADAVVKIVVTDGVFSMEGDIANLPEMVQICRDRGATGRGAHEHFGLTCRAPDGVDIITGTLGKALGGGNGGFVAGSKDLVDYLVQRSRPHLFSNALAPPTACAALTILEREPERVGQLHANVEKMRRGLDALGYEVIDSPTGIIPIVIGDTATAIRASEKLLERGIFVVGFGFPVVPEGRARLRVQMSAAHTDEHIEHTLDVFAALQNTLGAH